MPTFRVTTHFGQANMGFSETWWINKSTLNQAIQATAQMLDFRNTCLSAIHSIIACRVATEGQSAQSQLLLPGTQTLSGGSTPVTIPSQGDYPEGSSNLQYDQVRANLHNVYLNQGRKLSLRYMVGIPDVSSKTESATLNTTDPAQWWINWRNYHVHLQEQGWTIKGLVRGVANPQIPVLRWVLKGTPPSVIGAEISGATALTLNVGDKIQVMGTRMTSDGIRTPNKIWIVDDYITPSGGANRTVYLRGSEGIDPSTIRILGKIRPVVYDYFSFDQVRPLRMGIHKRGKPFNSPRGRAKTKRYAA